MKGGAHPSPFAALSFPNLNKVHCKKIRRFYGKIRDNQLPVHIQLFLRTSACRTFLEMKNGRVMLTDNTRKYLLGFKGYMTKSNTCLFATVLCLIPENVYGRP